MNNPTFQTVLNALCLQSPLLVKTDGSVNHNAVSRETKIPQPTITRALNGEVDSPRGTGSEKLCRYFHVSLDQLVGRAEIEGLFQDDDYQYPQNHSITGNTSIKVEPRAGMEFSGARDKLADHLATLDEDGILELIEGMAKSLSPDGQAKLFRVALPFLGVFVERIQK